MAVGEAIWIGSSNWVSEAPEWTTSSKKKANGRRVEIDSGTHGEFRTGLVAKEPHHVSWISLLSQHVKRGQGKQALQLYDKMREGGVTHSSHSFVAALKACSSLKDLERTKEIHAQASECGFESDVYVGTMLVGAYVKCGSLVDARRVFQEMPHRNVIVWTSIILGYAQMEEGKVALELYIQMQREGFVPNNRTFVAALKACSSLAALASGNRVDGVLLKDWCLKQVKAIHSDIQRSGSETDVFVGTMLVDAYAKCESLVDARRIFDKMPHRDVVCWTAMILGYAQMEDGEEALQLYTQMQQAGVVINDRTFVGALKACSSLAAQEEGTEVDGVLVKNRSLRQVRAIHSQLANTRFESDLFVGTMLVDVYAKCGSLEDSRRVFDKMPRRNVVSWTAMILGYAQMESGAEALQLYAQMRQDDVVPNNRTFVGALKACSSLAAVEVKDEADARPLKKCCLEHVKAIHLDVVKNRSESDIFVGTMLVDAYAKCGNLEDARRVFERMPHRDVVSWTAMILGYAQMEKGDMALELYTHMQQEGVAPCDRTFLGALRACSSLAALEEETVVDRVPVKQRCLKTVRGIHSDVMKRGLESDRYVGTMLVDVYAKCGSLADATHVFEKMSVHDVVSWTALISGYAQTEEGETALHMYDKMQQEGIVPDARTFVAALMACGSVAGLEKGKKIHAQISKTELEATDSFVTNTLIDMYGKCGSMDAAKQVFDAWPTRDVVTWNALIAGYARQGESQLVFSLFARMRQEAIQPDGVTFLCILTACSHGGLVDDGKMYFEAMQRDYGVTPTIDHFTCMIDLLGRVGQVDKAMEIVNTMPFEADGAVWQIVLGACMKWSNVELGRQAFECAVKLYENEAAPYILMASIYTAAQMWEEAEEIQTRRMKTAAWKKPGQSWWTDMDGSVHTFLVADRKYHEARLIYSQLKALCITMGEIGFLPCSIPGAQDTLS